eukprot:TRINITY_DN6053_c0_g1_i4.p2 TRINITY_DN6053_c0_g1~~TRINITY_DN6053_c0_g1_i4.p2  ORF type:complete len:124 (-),score=52.67 TRINITY_DN6053_c0_g1_i4:98-469(-)
MFYLQERCGALNVLARRIIDIENLDIVLAKLSSEKERAEYCKAFKVDPATLPASTAVATSAEDAAPAANTPSTEGDAAAVDPSAPVAEPSKPKEGKKKKKKRRKENLESQGMSRRFIEMSLCM